MFLAADSVVLALRALSFVAIFQAVGNALFLDLFGARLSTPVEERVRTLARIAAVAALCLAVLHYVLTPARMAGNLGATFDSSLSELLRESDAGTAHIVRIVGLAVLFLSLDRRTRLNTIAMRRTFWPSRTRPRRPLPRPCACALKDRPPPSSIRARKPSPSI